MFFRFGRSSVWHDGFSHVGSLQWSPTQTMRRGLAGRMVHLMIQEERKHCGGNMTESESSVLECAKRP